MDIDKLETRENIGANKKLTRAYQRMQNLLGSLKKKQIVEEVIVSINLDIKKLNCFSESDRELRKFLNKTCTSILKNVEDKLDLIPKFHYRNLGMGIGISFGVAFASISGSIGLSSIQISIATGICIGMGIGMIVGGQLDKKAETEGRQLDFESV